MQSGFDLSKRWARVAAWALVLACIGLFCWPSLTRHLSFAFPTSGWKPGEVIRDRHLSPIPADVPPEAYSLLVGFYERATGERVVLQGGGDFAPLQTGVIVR